MWCPLLCLTESGSSHKSQNGLGVLYLSLDSSTRNWKPKSMFSIKELSICATKFPQTISNFLQTCPFWIGNCLKSLFKNLKNHRYIQGKTRCHNSEMGQIAILRGNSEKIRANLEQSTAGIDNLLLRRRKERQIQKSRTWSNLTSSEN